MRRLLSRGALLVVVCLFALTPVATASDIVISQVYGGGGNSGAPYTHDYVELFNRGTSAVSINGWSIQYASATGTGNFGSSGTQLTELPNVSIQPGKYYLIQQAGGSTGSALPTPDLIDPTPIAMAAGAGKVALVTGTSTLGCNGGSTGCTAEQLDRILDLVGYGNANFFEGSAAAPTLTSTLAAFRADAGCTDTDDNAADFSAAAPAPRNSSTAANVCGGPAVLSLSISDVTLPEGNAGTTSFEFTVSLNAPAPSGGVTFDIATSNDTATTADNDYVAKTLIGQTIPEGQTSYTFEVLVNGDTEIESTETFFVNVTNVTGAEVSKSQGVGTITNDDFAPPVYTVVISQVYGAGGNSNAPLANDFVELFNNGSSSVSLAGWSVQYASSSGTTWQTAPLSGSIGPGRYYLVKLSGGANGEPLPVEDASGSINLSATAGKVALVSSTTALSGSCPAIGVIDLVGFGGANCFEGTAATPAPSTANSVHRKRGGCFDSNQNSIDFQTAPPNPRNSNTPERTCEYTPASIAQIQGNGLVTPYLDQDVSTTGIVTAKKSNGFFLQTPDNAVDSDPETSEGIFVFTSATPIVTVTPGDFVTVKGTATEFFDLTQISSTLPGEVEIHSTGNPLPAPITLTISMLDPNGSRTQLERFEGMRLYASTLTSVAPTNNFGETHTVLPGVPRPMREPGIETGAPIPPDPVSGVPDCCIPIWDRNPERIMIDADGLLGAPFVNVTTGVTLSDVTGPLDFSFGDYKILPETPPVTSANMSAVAVPEPLAGEVTIATFNIQNFTNNATQRQKAALAIRNILRSPDIIGHVEIGSLAALEALATQVNDDAVAASEPNPGYEARLIPFGTGSQHVGFLVKTSRVTIDSVTQVGADETFINPETILHDRPPLVLRATVDPATPRRRALIAVLLHNRSFIDSELVDGDGPRVRAKRTAQAESVAAIIQGLQTDNPNTPVMVVGDYNAFEFNDGYTDPVSIIKGTPTSGDQVVVAQSPDLVTPDFINLTDGLPADQRYTYIFEGTPQALDHVLVNSVVEGYVKRYAVGRANADFPAVPSSLFASDVTRPERSSDHDMPVAYFKFPSITNLSVNKPVLNPPNHKMVKVNVSYTPVDRCGTLTKSLSVTSNEPVLGVDDGNTSPDWEIIDGHSVFLRAERSGVGTGRIYTITVKVEDSCGLITEDDITVLVPLESKKK
ncbi:MAG TPA: lamin tail domain-containing protein [Thermoanaerobaculia bacterium]